ncbi:glycosyltransferase family 2 protein [Hymenobacter sp. GOD-10R]|uniref:glycosyltransferase family 2 protein n=1 Tax=Hymenobacter sp. GOD-10R TaxID=3093922 RepID=UPI002D77E587|nr:glycosyltransferase family 2 protein [Hymenobacter sp. GOD-10R]WRQ27456.1 glycosyltransferase family 2 protein [Hymenobacter sp. GOD-10R]
MNKTISIITVNFNNKEGLVKTLRSVFEQRRDVFEYIVVDGGSADGSIDIINAYAATIDYWSSEPDTGIYNAMNKGISKATGNYLLFLNSGDCFFDKNTIENCYNFLIDNQEVDIVYGDVIVDKGVTIWRYPTQITFPYLHGSTINHQASLIKASLFSEFGPYPEKYRLASDYWLFLIAFLNNKCFKHVNMFMVDYDYAGISAVDNFSKYNSERLSIWNTFVPENIKVLVTENILMKNFMQYKLVKLGMNLNKFYQQIFKR